jgi:hypothetical protein
MPAAPSQGGTTGSAPDGKSPAMGRTPASLSPDVDAAVKRVREGGPQGGGVIQTAPNEVVVPLRPQGSPPPAPPAGSVTK